MLVDIYIDHPHKINFITNNHRKWVIKSVINKNIQYREFYVQRLLQNTGVVPQCKNYNEAFFWEQYIYGKVFASISNIKDKHIIQLAKTLSCVHKFADPLKHLEIFGLKGKKLSYDPMRSISLVMKNSMLFSNADNIIIRDIGIRLKKKLQDITYDLSIIHGDVSLNNVILSNNKIYLIDWTDCRIDVGIADVVQVIHLFNLNNHQKNLLLRNYHHPLNFPSFVDFLLLMHALYDYHKKQNTPEHNIFESKLKKRILKVTKYL